jgi:hypothetical protein
MVSLSFVRREVNGVAHSLVAQVRLSNTVGFWLKSIPVTSEPMVGDDCNTVVMQNPGGSKKKFK